MKKILFLSVLLSILFSGFVFGELKENVEGIGMAAGVNQSAHDEALQKALRDALERSIGVLITSESLTNNYQLIEDHIYSNVQGYVTDYKIVEEDKSSDMTRIKVSASVKGSKLEKDLNGIKVILKAKGNPETMIIIEETMDDDSFPLISSEIETFFIQKTFPLIDKKQMEVIKLRDAGDIYSDPSKAKILGSRFGAALIITGSAKSFKSSERKTYGISVYTYSGNLNLKAIHTDTGEILAVLNKTSLGHDGDPGNASMKAISESWNQEKDNFFKTIMGKWRSSVLNTAEITIIISKCNPEMRKQIKDKLSAVYGITDLTERTYTNGTSEYSATVDGTVLKSLDEKIVDSLPELLLTSKTANRLDFEISNE